jgi:hypothetical protein
MSDMVNQHILFNEYLQGTISTILFFSNLKEPSWTVITKFGCIWCSTSSKEDANVSEGHLGKPFDQLHDTIL